LLKLTYRSKLAIHLKYIIYISLLFFQTWAVAQEVWMTPNLGQWDDRISFSVDINQGKLYIEKTALTYYLSNAMAHAHEDGTDHETAEKLRVHAIQQSFIGANSNAKTTTKDSSQHYANYFIGNDPAKWKSKIHSVSNVKLSEFYPNIDLIYSTKNGTLSYNFEINNGGDPSKIQFKIDGADKFHISENGALIIGHTFGEIIQSAPKAWTIDDNGKKEFVPITFLIENDICSFTFPQGYDPSKSLYIDPSLTFSTFSGSTADNWGFTATPDLAGNLFGGGIVFGVGYPLSIGAYDASFNSGSGIYPIDIGITKFNSNGSALLYSTYLGGNGNETPHSLVASTNGDLYLYGVTSSSNFPMAGASYDNSFNGGPFESENSLDFNGTDIYVAKLSANGTSLLASTYIGGSGTDGLNTNSLQYNYGDQFRGEIILDVSGNVYVSSTSESPNFPIVPATSSLTGSQDAVIFKLNSNLNSLLWSRYFGGTGLETGNSIDYGSNGSLYVAGGTTSSSLPLNTGNDLTFNGGMSDGYVLRLNSNSGAVIAGSYMGLNEYDQAYFVRIDVLNNAYVYGQTESPWAVTPGCYSIPNSGQFLRKYSSDLSTISWTTMIGAGSGHVEISPTAFLISDCFDIYIAGWGGILNASISVSQATFSTSNGFQCTPNGFQLTTNGNNFYLALLSQDAATLKYATYMGGLTGSSNHVDGGTSRFDKSGRIYHAVCGACGGNPSGFTSTLGAWSAQNQSTNCNLACFKFDLNAIDAIISQPAPYICIPQPVIFNNLSQNGNTYEWDFGDGTTSNLAQPSHVYPSAGTYIVQLIVSDSIECYTPDTAYVTVIIGDFQGGVTLPNSPICPGETYQLTAFGGSNYAWSPSNVLDNPTIPNPVATITTNTIFTVIISDSCGSDTLEVPLNIFSNSLSISNDTSICIGQSVSLFASGNGTVEWTPPLFLNNSSILNPISTPDTSITYVATFTSFDGCMLTDSVYIDVYFNPPNSALIDSLELCEGTGAFITISGGTSYFWYPNNNINPTNTSTVFINPTSNQYYYCDVTNVCGTITDSIYVNLVSASIIAGNDTIVCPGEEAYLWASGAVSYQWLPSGFVVAANGGNAIVIPTQSTQFLVIGTDQNGCKDSAYVEIVLYPQPYVQVNASVLAFYGDLIQLNAVANQQGVYTWSPPEFLSCINCPNPIANPDMDMTYYVSFVDENGCETDNLVMISYEAVIYVPNTFIPDGNDLNDLFGVYGGNISAMKMVIFDRWGELICTLNSTAEFWDGTYKGKLCQDGTYTWRLIYSDKQDKKYELLGHVNLLR
jgi:gliding motility-associated-like protein